MRCFDTLGASGPVLACLEETIAEGQVIQRAAKRADDYVFANGSTGQEELIKDRLPEIEEFSDRRGWHRKEMLGLYISGIR